MHHFTRATALCALLALFAWQQNPIQAEPKDGDWATNWNTWKDAERGDWAEYSLGNGITYKDEVLKVSGGNITYSHTTFSKGVQTSQQEKTRDWVSIKLQIRMPYGKEKSVEWTEEVMMLGDVELNCDKAKWTIGAATTEAYFCKDVPCGGVVKQITNGKDVVWLSAYHSEKKGSGKTDKPDPVADIKTDMPRFYAAPNNQVILKITGTGRDASYQLRTVTTVEEKSAKWTSVACSEDGQPNEGAKTIDNNLTKEDWDKDYAKPSEKNVKLNIGGTDYVCDVFKSKDDKLGREITEWVSEGAPLKKVIKSKTGETVLEATKVVMK